jgi:hypothetical protein
MKKKNSSIKIFVMLCGIVLGVSLSSGGVLMAQQHPGPAAALSAADGEQPDQRVEVTELKRTSGGTVNLKFVMINDSNKDISFWQNFGGGNTISGVTLVDEKNKKKYFVVQDSERNCLRINLWAKFPAPPEDVEKISVSIPHFQPMDDVPISR